MNHRLYSLTDRTLHSYHFGLLPLPTHSFSRLAPPGIGRINCFRFLLRCAALVLLGFCFGSFSAHAQCSVPVAQGTCSGGSGAATDGGNINSGQTYWFTGGPTTFSSGINMAGGTLRVCGNLTLSSLTFNSGTIIVTAGGSLTINGSGTLFFNGNCSVYNFGTLTINRGVTMQNANNLLMNASPTAVFNMNSGSWILEINSSTSAFVNYGAANVHTLFV